MASAKIDEIMKQVETLSTTEQLELIALVAQKARGSYEGSEPPAERTKWSEIMGIAPDLLDGEDAQEWVTRTRRESDETEKSRSGGPAPTQRLESQRRSARCFQHIPGYITHDLLHRRRSDKLTA
jgi:hypothetical protein